MGRGDGKAWRLLGLGWYVPLCIVSGAFIGYKLDQRFGTAPWIALAGVTIGLIFALVGMWLMVRPLLKEDKGADKKED